MIYQRTISKKVSVTGIGIHSGKKVTLTLNPAPVNSGITFKRVDLPDSPVVKADARTVGTTENNTSLGSGVSGIHTVEHLLVVFYGLGVNNVYCEIDGPEIPIMDGSGASFVFLLREVGVSALHQPRNFLVILEPVRVEVDDKWAEFTPAPRLIVDSTIIFAHPKIKQQNLKFEFHCENFINDIGRARTFGFLKEVDMLKRKGLIKGGSLANAIVLDDFNVVNPEGLRYRDEFVRHKILDTIGDLSLLGHEIAGRVTTYKSGHNLHNLLCRKLLDTPQAYKIVPATVLQKEAVESLELSFATGSLYH